MVQKQCHKCKEWKDKSEFSKNKEKKDNLQSNCKACNKLYRDKNKKKISSYLKQYRILNKEKIKKSKSIASKIYWKQNKQRIIKYRNSNAKYKLYKNKLTIDEEPRLSEDGVSLEVKCRYCGKYFIPTNTQVQNRTQALNGSLCGDHGLYCSDGCKSACPIFWKTEWPNGFKQGTSREVQPQLRQLVLARDNYTCTKCGNLNELHCHHIWPLNESPITSADIDECITLCKKCHKKVHQNVKGCGYYEMRCGV